MDKNKWWVKSKCWNKIGYNKNDLEKEVFNNLHLQSYCYIVSKHMPYEFTKLEEQVFKLERHYMVKEGYESEEAVTQIHYRINVSREDIKKALSICSLKIISRENEGLPPIPLNLV